MVMEALDHLRSFVTWRTNMELVWQSLVTIAKTECWSMDMKEREVTFAMFITQERVWLMFHSWLDFWMSPLIVSSSSSMNATILFSCILPAIPLAGGCHVTRPKWRIGVEPRQLIPTSAHAGWHLRTRVQTPLADAIVIRMIPYGVRTVAYSLRSPTFLFRS